MTSHPEQKHTRTAFDVVRVPLALAAVTIALLLSLAPAASAKTTLCAAGTGAGQCIKPEGLAADTETGHIYVVDKGNNRIDVFQPDGTFLFAFGWGVDTGESKLQNCTTATGCNAGIAGAGAGQFSSPSWIAVDNNPASPSRHDVYVGTDNFRVQKFTPTGEFIESLGEEGTGECQFAGTRDPIAVGPGGDLYVADSYEQLPVGSNNFVSRVERFDTSGACVGVTELFQGEHKWIRAFAVDSTGDSYVTVRGAGAVLRKYDPSGTLLYELDSSTFFGGPTENEGLAVDGFDNLFAKQRGTQVKTSGTGTHFITEYGPDGSVLKRFDYVLAGERLVPGLAAYASAGGVLFASEGPRESIGTTEVTYLTLPPPGPVVLPEGCRTSFLGNAKATLLAEVNPEGKATTVHYEYITEADFIANGNSFKGAHPAQETAESESIGDDFELQEASADAALTPETKYHCRVVASNADGSAIGPEGTFTSKAPLEIGPTTVMDVGTDTATLNVLVNPLGIPTSGYFEYVAEAIYQKDVAELGPEHGFDHASKAPATGEEPIEFGASESFAAGSVQIAGLAPATDYRFRVVVTDIKLEGKEIKGPTAVFRTFGDNSGSLPDDRAWELVSPGLKNSAEVAVPGAAGGLFEDRTVRIQAGSGSGEAITYTSWTSFADAESAPATSQYLSRRTSSGWKTENISPFGFISSTLVPPYSGFDAGLGFGSVKVSEPALTAECPEEFENLYLRNNATGALQCLTPEAPDNPKEKGICFVFAGASKDGSRAFFGADAAYAGAPKNLGNFFSLYEWSAANGLQAISVLPKGSKAVVPTQSTSFGTDGENCQVGQKTLRHVVSEDGSRAFWTYVPEGEKPTTQLLVRANGSETVQLDALPTNPATKGPGPAGNGFFGAASTDGSVVYFTDTGKLVKGSKASVDNADLYRYQIGKAEPLTDLTKGANAEVQGVVGASDDGSYVYFVAKGVLSGEEENSAGKKAQAGKGNLYLFHEGKTSFVGTLSAELDSSSWSSQPKVLRARVTPDGRHLAFLSVEAEALAGYDNTIAGGDECRLSGKVFVKGLLCAQALIYDADTGSLTCASCNPSGARPLGPAVLPAWSSAYEGPRYLSDDGSRLFFESFDALVLADENGKRDVYEFEREDTGDCTGQSPSFSPVSGGCISLLSSGKSEDETFLIDASSNGRDAFLSTRSSLVAWDVNENYDVYDTRAGGGFPEPQEEAICEGEGCKPPAAGPPGISSPVTPHFQGSGNQAQKQKKQKKSKKSKHKKKHASHKRRAGR